jgi:hypothetical protein
MGHDLLSLTRLKFGPRGRRDSCNLKKATRQQQVRRLILTAGPRQVRTPLNFVYYTNNLFTALPIYTQNKRSLHHYKRLFERNRLVLNLPILI